MRKIDGGWMAVASERTTKGESSSLVNGILLGHPFTNARGLVDDGTSSFPFPLLYRTIHVRLVYTGFCSMIYRAAFNGSLKTCRLIKENNREETMRNARRLGGRGSSAKGIQNSSFFFLSFFFSDV